MRRVETRPVMIDGRIAHYWENADAPFTSRVECLATYVARERWDLAFNAIVHALAIEPSPSDGIFAPAFGLFASTPQ